MIQNLAQLKRALKKGAEFQIVDHRCREYIGQHRKVNVANTVGIYSIVPDEPNNKVTLANDGRGFFLGWPRASLLTFKDGICSLYDNEKEHTDEHCVLAIKVMESDRNSDS